MAHVTNFSFSKSDHKGDHYCSHNSNNSDSSVRIVLFKECRFKERQLIFDSSSPGELKNNDPLKCPNTFLQPYFKSTDEFSQLTEMIFGSTAMRYHGTYFKVHNISSPERIVVTQVFATPYKKRLKKSTSSFNSKKLMDSFCHSNEWDINYGENSIIFMSDNFSNVSLESSISIFRKNSSNTTASHSSTNDSGFSEQSLYSSFDSVSQFDNTANLENSPSVFSNLESSTSDNFHNSFRNKSSCQTKSNLGYSRLGLAIIITVATEKSKYQYFVMNHISFIESILWRIRQYIEYTTSTSRGFLLQMFTITNESTHYLKQLTSDFKVVEKFWNRNSLSENYIENSSTEMNKLSIFAKFRKMVAGKFISLKHRTQTNPFERSCRLIQQMEVKETNFFLSSLLSAILTNYSGWVTTCCESSANEENEILRISYNALWNQFKDLCGQTGKSKISKIIVYDSNKNIIKDILDFLLYYIRYSCVQKKEIERENIVEEEEIVSNILNNGYVDVVSENVKYKKSSGFSLQKSLNKTKTFSSNLSELGNIEQCLDIVPEEESVIFILGDDEQLVNLKKNDNSVSIAGDIIHDKKHTTNKSFLQSLQTHYNNRVFTTLESEDNAWNRKIQNNEIKPTENKQLTKVVKFPLPKVKVTKDCLETTPYKFSLQNVAMETFEPHLILQGIVAAEQTWKNRLQNDLLTSHTCTTDNNLEETVAILGDMNKWKVQVLSNKKQSVLRASASESVDSSQLVAEMLEVTQQMWKLGIPKQYCTTHIEQRLSEICLKSNAVAQLLLSSDFCTVDLLVSSLDVTVSDMPLLMSVASSLCPEITKKYGLSYQ